MKTTKRIGRDTTIARADGLLAAEVGTEVVMLSLANNAYYDTNHIGAAIWKEIATPIPVGALVEVLMNRYDVAREVCEADVITFLEQARREGLITVVDADDSDL